MTFCGIRTVLEAEESMGKATMEKMEKEKRKVTLFQALLSITSAAILIFTMIVRFGAQPQIPMLFGCVIAGVVSFACGFSWQEIIDGATEGISQALEAILILLLIGMLIGMWIAAGTVPALIYYGLQVISAKYFLLLSMLLCGAVSLAIGAWGTVGTVGIAFMGIGLALGIPAPAIAGSVISGSYFGEIVSPLSDAVNLTAAVMHTDPFALLRKTLTPALCAAAAASAVFFVIGLQYKGGDSQIAVGIEPILQGLADNFCITPAVLLPILLMALCIALRIPAIPSMLVGIISGAAVAALIQKISLASFCAICFDGYVSTSGNELMDSLLTAGGLSAMMDSISIVIIAMAFGGIMQHTGQMEVLIAPLIRVLPGKAQLNSAIVLMCICMNVVLPDQYLGISVPGQMFQQEYSRRGYSCEELGRTLLCGGAVTSPLIPWNTCGVYCRMVLGVGSVQYFPYAMLGLFLPVLCVVSGFCKKEKQ